MGILMCSGVGSCVSLMLMEEVWDLFIDRPSDFFDEFFYTLSLTLL